MDYIYYYVSFGILTGSFVVFGWKQKWDKGVCSSCKLPFDNGKKRCIKDSCGHHRCYACLCAQDACTVCTNEVVRYDPQDQFAQISEKFERQKSIEILYHKRLKISNKSIRNSADLELNYYDRNPKRFSQISNLSSEFSFDVTFQNAISNGITLKPLYFEVPQSEEESSFLYRDWILEEICKVILSSNLKGVVLVGDEGSGKTSLILQLVEWSIFGQKRKSAILNDVASNSLDTLMRLSSIVVGYHFCQSECTETCLIPDFIHSLAAQLCQAPQLEEYRNFLVREESYQQLLSLESCMENPDKAFQKGIIEPLVSLASCPVFPGILVIDSINESEDQSRSISSFLATYVSQFPSWLKVVMTVNTDNVSVICSLPLHRMNLNCNELKVKGDLLRYIRCRVNRYPSIATNISACGSENQISRFAEHLISNEKASFLFVKLILDLLQHNHLVIKSTTFNVIPVSLDEIFLLTFNLRFPSTAAFSKVKPILEICLASLSPLTAIEIFYSLESGSVKPSFSWSNFTLVLSSLSGILMQRKDESLMLSHPALRRWLAQNKKFTCDVRCGHTYLALLPTRLRYLLTPEKELELIHHLSRCNLFDNEETLKLHWVHHSSITSSAVLIKPRVVFSPDEQIMHLLLKTGADANSILHTYHKYPILNYICKRGFVRIVSLLLNFGADRNTPNAFGITPLMEAASHGHLKIVEILLSAGAKVQLKDKAGRCVLTWAAEKDHFKVVEVLLKNNGWPSQISRTQAIQRALVAASGKGNFEMCEYLRKMTDAPESSITELRLARSLDHAAICELLLNNISGLDHLHQAAAFGHIHILRVLFNKGISLDTKDANGRTALSWACASGNIDVVRFLLEKGANTATKDNNLCSLLHTAAIHGNGNIVNLLLNYSMDTESKNSESKTPLECAISTRNFSTILALLNAGVDIGSGAFECAQDHPKLRTILLNKLLSDGVSLYKKGQIIEANRRFEYAWSKASIGANFEQIRACLREGLYRCKNKMDIKDEPSCSEKENLVPIQAECFPTADNLKKRSSYHLSK